jgi:RNA polymerase sigma-70 factor (ECF subfamily)
MTALTEPPVARPVPTDVLTNNQLAAIVQTHQAAVWRLLRYLGAAGTEADDLTQETFLALARSDFAPQTDGQTAAYLRQVAKNQLLMLRRQQRREVNTVSIEAAQTVWAQEIEARGWDAYTDALRGCLEKLEKLDGRARQAIDLSYRDGQGRETIAEQLQMKPEGVKTLLRRTRKVLRECIEKQV